ncbi:hypothetical protein D3C71_1928800 [compost metagenome]
MRDLSIRSRACSCRSVDVKRARTVPSVPLVSKKTPSLGILASVRICSTRLSMAGSTLMVALALETWTAGDSP